MDVAAHAIRHLIFPLWVKKNSSARLTYLKELEASQYYSREQIEAHQLSLLQNIIAHAFETCPYYRSTFKAARVSPSDIRSRSDLDRIPTITKEEIQANTDAMISTNVSKGALIADMTGGSTGSPMKFYYDEDRHDSREAAALRHDRWTGWNIGERRAILWGAPRDTRPSGNWKGRAREVLIDRRILLDASSIDDAAMSSFQHKLAIYRPAVIQAYANTLGLFARFVEANGGINIALKGIITSAEILTPENRKLIERVFNCPVYDRYGCREVSVIASECSHHRGMHINAENLLVEVVKDGRSRLDEDGEVVITDLRNLAMPLIRYRIQDVGRVMSKACGCSRGLPVMSLSGGRVSDFLTAANGRKVSGIVLATYVITNLPGVRQVQFVQSESLAVDVNLIKGDGYSDSVAAELQERLKTFLGEEMNFRVHVRTTIPASASGKHRFSISTL